MRRWFAFSIDLALVAVATFGAQLLKDNLDFYPTRLPTLLPYMAFSVCMAAVVLPALGTVRAIWRFTSVGDYFRILVATAIIVSGAELIGFAFNRLDGIARSLPILQGILIIALLVGARVLMRLQYTRFANSEQVAEPLRPGSGEMVLVVGISRLTELYLRSVAELAPARVHVAGLLARRDRHTGLSVHQVPVLGTPEQLSTVIRNLEVHGVFINRVVVATTFESLSNEAREALHDVENTDRIRVDFLAEQLGLDPNSRTKSGLDTQDVEPADVFNISSEQRASIDTRPYWRIKRAVDFVAALTLLVVAFPAIFAVGLLVAIDIGFPVAFWQQRPGMRGRPFKLYKFRTMAAAHDDAGRRLSDDERVSTIGRALRRTRLDELPQLFNILTGAMSFVGPRPLLPVDQPAEYAARLLVRPGLTGWAQVGGGRAVSAADKAALDIWYVRNASFRLDLRILLHTVHMVVFGERTNLTAIDSAWTELTRAGICAPHVAERWRSQAAKSGSGRVQQAA